jgi:hypothetical protein
MLRATLFCLFPPLTPHTTIVTCWLWWWWSHFLRVMVHQGHAPIIILCIKKKLIVKHG